MNSKYSNFLTVLLVLIIIAIIAIIGFLGFKYYQTYISKNEAEEFVETYFGDTQNNSNTNNNTSVIPPSDEDENIYEGVDEGTNNNSGGNSSSSDAPKYNGFLTAGSIEIPATSLKCPIIARSEYSEKALKTAVVELYGPGLNQVGNTTISGHNYRNNTFFSNNKKLNIGDKIYITDLTGKKLSYTIYNKFEAEENYADYMVRDTNGAIEISLSTCTDDSKKRLIIFAKADA